MTLQVVEPLNPLREVRVEVVGRSAVRCACGSELVENERGFARCADNPDETFGHGHEHHLVMEYPPELGGGTFDLDDPTCPMCGALPNECEPWCELARLDR